MNAKRAMDDLLVVIPGITGSVLQKGGNTIWGPVPQSIVGYIESLFGPAGPWSFDDLSVVDDDPEVDDLGDGIQATGLVPYTLIPGLDCFDGYTGLTRQLRNTFDLRIGDVASEGGPPANYVEFPYDWRRDNRASARRLKRLVDRELPKWRAFRDYPDAKVILIGHSMGGLIARYYVECLEGFKDTRALITFGTPHRGSVQTIEYLVNGYRRLGLRLGTFTELMRSFRSVYQLLPIYECVLVNGQNGKPVWRRAAETTLPEVNAAWAQDALQFHRQIEKCHDENKDLDEYDVKLLPVIGWGHDTLQSARYLGHGVEVGADLPPAVDKVLTDGDGTVPRVSAIPIELHKHTEQWWPWNQKHATIQNNETLLGNVAQTLSVLQGQLGKPARGPGAAPEQNKINLKLEEVYLSGEPVSIRVTATTTPEPSAVLAQVAALANGSQPKVIRLKSDGNVWCCEELFAPGAYRVAVRFEGVNVDPVTDVFEVA
jgi:pimeloyl-ACP methyl ester carboxylesterase